MAVIKDVAKRAGVSVATVSRYFNAPHTLKDTTKARVEEAVRELQYTTNPIARNLRLQCSRQLALFVPDIYNAFYAELYNLVREVVEARGYSILFYTTQENTDIMEQCLQNPLLQNVDGLIFSFMDEPDLVPRLLELEKRLPLVLMSWNVDNVDFNCVIVDMFDGIYKTTRHLLELGHQRIAYIGGTVGSRVSEDKFGGYKKALTEAGIALREEYLSGGWYQFGTGFRAARRLMQLDEPPTAIVCANDVLAIGAIKYLTKQGLRVGREMAVTGMDNITFSRIFEPAITTVSMPMQELAEQSVEMLLHLMEHRRTRKQQKLYQMQLLVRNSTVEDAVVDFEF